MDFDVIEFTRYLFQVDEMAIILKSHLEIERAIDRLLDKVLSDSSIVLRWAFSKKIDVLYSLGLIGKDIHGKLNQVNALRNKFSHRHGYRLSSEDQNFLLSIAGDPPEVPEEFRKIPSIKETLLLAGLVSYFSGYLAAAVAKKHSK